MNSCSDPGRCPECGSPTVAAVVNLGGERKMLTVCPACGWASQEALPEVWQVTSSSTRPSWA